MSDFSDQFLLRAWVRGDRSAFDALFRRYAARVHATAHRLTGQWEDAEDVLQEVFVALSRKAATIRSGAALSAWLYRTTLHRSYDALRRRRPTVSLDASPETAQRVIAIESLRRQARADHARDRMDLLEQIAAEVPQLPTRQAEVFVLRGFQGLPYREIAAVLECSEGAAKASYSLACRRLRAWVAARDDASIAPEKKKKQRERAS